MRKHHFISKYASIWALMMFSICSMYLIINADKVNIATLNLLVIFNVLQSTIIILFCIWNGKLKERFTLFTFNIAYMILLQGAFICNLGNDYFWGRHIFSTVSYLDYINEAKGLFYILLAQMITFIAYVTSNEENWHRRFTYQRIDHIKGIRYWCKIFMVIGGVAAFTKVGLKVFFVAQNGYLATYLATGNELYQNTIIDLFDKFYYVGFYGYLATFPNMRKLRTPLIFFMLYSILTLMTGTRGEIVLNTLFILWYFMKRDEFILNDNVVITKKRSVVLAILIILSFSLLFEYGYSRMGSSSTTASLSEKIFMFIKTQGGTGKLVALGIQNKNEMLQYSSPFMLLFYPIRNFLINNSLVRIFTGGSLGQNISTLYHTGSFGDILTYVTNPTAYLNGAGLGTSYVTEIVLSFGTVGILAFSVILGKIFFRIDHIQLNQWTCNIFWINAFVILTYLPRNAALDIIPSSVFLGLFIVSIHILTHTKKTELKHPLSE